MNKPSGYDEARVAGEFTPVNLGGHYAVVKQVAERQSSTGKDMIVVLFDFCNPDEQAGYFEGQYENDTRSQNERKWPFNGTKYIMVNDYQDPKKTSSQFKTFCSCIEKSNNYTIQWGGNTWAQQFKGKKLGVVFGEEEHEYDGKISMRRVPKWFCGTESVATARVPEPKYLNGQGPATRQVQTDSNGFMNISDDVKDEEIPF